ncbi:MAG: PaaI family thioesterase [Deltaproteobacteria bacterium]|nr:PaaI family thioesterase [Deltaproteobacteria bacterium]
MSSSDSGGRGRDFPPLDAAAQAAIMHAFNDDNPHFPGHCGFRVVELRQGYARLEVENRTALCNPVGVMHGGASFGLADTAVAAALFTVYGAGNALLTIEMKINYLEPIFPGPVQAEAFVLRHSRRSAYAEVDVWSGGKLAARASTTYMIKPLGEMRPPAA